MEHAAACYAVVCRRAIRLAERPAVSRRTGSARSRPVRLSAAASDDYAVARVEFYRVEPNGAVVRLGTDTFLPYAWDTVLPDSPGGAVRYLARSVDDAGQVTDSAWVSVVLQR